MLERTILKRDRLHIAGLLKNLNATIARYISGVSIDAIIIGCLAYIGYSIIGLKYALVLPFFWCSQFNSLCGAKYWFDSYDHRKYIH